MSRTTSRAISVIISRLITACLPYCLKSGGWPRPSPAMTILLVVQSVSHPSRVFTLLSSAMPSLTSFSMKASRTASEIWSQILSGWPSETDSLVNRWLARDTDDLPLAGPTETAAFVASSRSAAECGQAVGEDGTTPKKDRVRKPRLSVVRQLFSPSGLIIIAAGNLFDQIDDAAPELWLLDPHEGFRQRKSFGSGEKIRHIGRRGSFFRPVTHSMQVGCALEKECHGNLQDVGNLLQSACSDAIRAFLVFLHLLEGEVECIPEFFLAHRQHHPTHAHPAADVPVDGIGSLFGGHNILLYGGARGVMSVEESSKPPLEPQHSHGIRVLPSRWSCLRPGCPCASSEGNVLSKSCNRAKALQLSIEIYQPAMC